jgi:hypothetical protein
MEAGEEAVAQTLTILQLQKYVRRPSLSLTTSVKRPDTKAQEEQAVTHVTPQEDQAAELFG